MLSVGRCGVARLQMKFGHMDGMHCIIDGTSVLVRIKSVALYNCQTVYVPLIKSLFKSTGITVSQFFSMLPPTLKYIYSVEPARMHFPAKQPCTNDTVCNAAKQHCTQYHLYTAVLLQGRWQHGEKVGYCYPSGLEKTLCKWDMYVPLVTKGLSNNCDLLEMCWINYVTWLLLADS